MLDEEDEEEDEVAVVVGSGDEIAERNREEFDAVDRRELPAKPPNRAAADAVAADDEPPAEALQPLADDASDVLDGCLFLYQFNM